MGVFLDAFLSKFGQQCTYTQSCCESLASHADPIERRRPVCPKLPDALANA